MSYQTTTRSLLRAFAFFRATPGGLVRVDWCTHWNRYQFRQWFSACLDRKINRNDTRTGRRLSDEWQDNARFDARTINEHARGIRCSGCRNILRTPELRAAYPHVNTQERAA